MCSAVVCVAWLSQDSFQRAHGGICFPETRSVAECGPNFQCHIFHDCRRKMQSGVGAIPMLGRKNSVIECRGQPRDFFGSRRLDFMIYLHVVNPWKVLGAAPVSVHKSKERNRKPDGCKTGNGSALRIASARGPGIPRIRRCRPTQPCTRVFIG